MVFVRLLGLLFRLVFLPFRAVFWALRRRFPRGAWLRIEIEGSVVELVPPRRSRIPIFAGGHKSVSIASLHALADEIQKEPRVRGVLVVLRGISEGMATSTSLRRALVRLRETGREVVVYLPNGGDTKELYIASAANRIYASPHSTLAPVGFASSARYAKLALDKLGVVADRLSKGAYKSAGETLDRDSMSEPQREQLGGVLDAFYDELVAALVSGRKVDEARAKEWIDAAPYSSEKAATLGLIDATTYEDALPALLGEAQKPALLISAERFLSARRAKLFPQFRNKPVLAVVPLHGAITSGSGPLAMDERVIAAIRIARASSRVRGVLLHVDSPGGGALASDRIHHELVQLAREKPVVAYFGNVAASGGYYAAAAAHYIVAEPTTITGSIGVIAARVIVDPLLQRLGIVTEVLKRGAHAALLDPFHAVDATERAVLEEELQGVYDGFVDVVAAGRKRSREDVHAVAQGRVWSGRDAKEKGLVDELGDARTAITALRSRVGASAANMDVVGLRTPWGKMPPLAPPRESGVFAALASIFGVDKGALDVALSRERVLAFSLLPRFFF